MIQKILEQAMEEGRREILFGETASYIPELGTMDKEHLGVCIYAKNGEIYESGDTNVRFTMQSISKVISLAVALQHSGFEKVFEKIGMEPSGDAFNSLVKLDLNSNYPYNPMINSGAITVTSYLISVVNFDEMLEYTRNLCMDADITLNEKVYNSETTHSSRNKAIAYLLESKGIIENDVEKTLEMYIKMCSLDVTARSLAGFGMILANDGVHPQTGERFLNTEVVRVVKTIMLTCGMYDGSGEFAVHVGIPSKSGVGGGILSVVDGRMGIGLFGPALDKKGNSIAGRYILRCLSDKLHLHMFAPEK